MCLRAHGLISTLFSHLFLWRPHYHSRTTSFITGREHRNHTALMQSDLLYSIFSCLLIYSNDRCYSIFSPLLSVPSPLSSYLVSFIQVKQACLFFISILVFVSSVSASPQHCILKTVLLVMINTSLLCVTAFFFFMCEYGGHWQVHMPARSTDLK